MLSIAADLAITKPGCPEKCGNVSIPYPYGIGRGCYLDPVYEIICNSSLQPWKPYLRLFNFEVEEITLKSFLYNEFQRITVKTPADRTCGIQNTNISSIDFGETPYWFPVTENVLIVEGCGSSVILMNRSDQILGGCSSLCDDQHHGDNKVVTSCVGIGCCQISLGKSDRLDQYSLNVFNFPTGSSNCTSTMLVSESYMSKFHVDSSNLSRLTASATVVGWMVANSTGLIMPSSDEERRHCQNYHYTAKMQEGFICFCDKGYYGNPYIPYGCQGNLIVN